MNPHLAYLARARRVVDTLRAFHVEPSSELVRDLTDLTFNGGSLAEQEGPDRCEYCGEPPRVPESTDWGEPPF